jgi:hypothetical protein
LTFIKSWKQKSHRRRDSHPNHLELQTIQQGKPYKVLTKVEELSRSRVIKTELPGGQKMREKANVPGNTGNRGSEFAPDRKEKQTSLGSYADESMTEIPNGDIS